MDRVVIYADSYSRIWNEHSRKPAMRGYIDGYHQCIEDGDPDIDAWQRRLSQDYSDLKVKYYALMERTKFVNSMLNKVVKEELTPEEARKLLAKSGLKIKEKHEESKV